MKSLIKKYYKSHKNIKRWKHHLSELLSNNKEFKKFKKDIFGFLYKPTDSQIFWHVLNNNYIKQLCVCCRKETTFNRQMFYHTYCSRVCTAKSTANNMTEKEKEKIVKTRETTNIKKYGAKYSSMTKEGKQKKIQTCLDKYGVENPLQNKEIHDKQFKTMQENNFKKYGKKSTRSLSNTIKQTEQTKIIKYGIKYGEVFSVKAKKTCLEKYGVENYTQTEDWYEKFKKHEWGNKYKDFIMPSGNIIRIQGYEDKALNKLLESKKETEIITGIEINKYTGKIEYLLVGKKHVYKPDIYIHKEKKIIEVKSTWTYKVQLEKNIIKANACKTAGFNYEFWIFDKKGNLQIINEF